jgi:hypothetical protein
MSEDDPVETNVERAPKEPANITAIRDAVQSLLPDDPNIVSNVSLHDGIADISLRWRSLRFNVIEAIAGRDADTIALNIDIRFRDWLKGTIQNMKNVPKHSRVAAEMSRWLRENPDKREWLYGKEETHHEAAADAPLPQPEVTS